MEMILLAGSRALGGGVFVAGVEVLLEVAVAEEASLKTDNVTQINLDGLSCRRLLLWLLGLVLVLVLV